MLGNRLNSEQILWKLRKVEVALTRGETVTQTDSVNRTGLVRRSHENQRLLRSNGNRQVTDAINASLVVRSFNAKSNGSTCHAH
jgi:hypothetical protein